MAEVKFGISQITNRTPLWAKYTFRITLLFTTAFVGWVGSTGLFEQGTKLEIVIGLKFFDVFIWGVSKLFGVEGEISPELVQQRKVAVQNANETAEEKAGEQKEQE